MTVAALDFTALTTPELVTFMVDHQAAMDVGGLEEADVTDALATSRPVLETRSYGIAVITLKFGAEGKIMPYLWLLFIAAERCGQGVGQPFVRELLKRYAVDYHMPVNCYGPGDAHSSAGWASASRVGTATCAV